MPISVRLQTLRRALFALLGMLHALPRAEAQSASEEIWHLTDAGQSRAFAPVRDRVAIRGANGRVRHQSLPLAANFADVARQARALRPAAGENVELILVESGTSPDDPRRVRYVRHEVVIEADSPEAARAAAGAAGLVYLRPSVVAGFHLLAAPGSAEALESLPVLAARADIRRALPSLARQQAKRLVPNDTYFTGQWHLRNTGQSSGLAGTDINVVNVWDTYRGTGQRIAIVDDGLQTAHPDLAANLDTVNDHDWNDATVDDPNPDLTVDDHGTACAGVAAARGNNGSGVSGAAPEATLVGLRLIGAATTDSQEAEAVAWKSDLIQIKSNSWGPNDDGLTLEAPGPLTAAAFANAAATGRGGLGTIFVWAGGNGGDVGDNSNYDGYANSIYTIAVGAVTNTGAQSYYSEPGANLVVCAPSSGGVDPGITTTDLTGSSGYNYTGAVGNLADLAYTNDFGGTSSATPLVSGVVALLLQSKPTLGWRDVQEILMRSATQVSPADADWSTNAAGMRFNHKFGAGMVNTSAAITLAQTWTNLPAASSQTLARSSLAQSIPDNNATGTAVTFDLSNNANLRAEHVTVTVNITHASRGHLAVTLTSPQGTVSRLAEKHADTGDNYASWTFMTVRNWGEYTQGVWTLRVSDLTSGTTGTLASATLTVHGTSAASLNRRPAVTAASLGSAELFAENSLPVSGLVAADPDGDTFTLAYQWQSSADNITFADISGATAATLPADATRAGLHVRCSVTPSDSGGAGTAFTTESRFLNRRPPLVVATGSAYAYDSELPLNNRSGSFSRSAIINEFSQGNGGSKEWVEILFLQNTDARGWTFSDASASTPLTFTQNALWANIPAGTLLVIYNGTDRDTALPADKTTLTGPGSLVIAHNNTSFFSSLWPALGNSGGDRLVLSAADASLIDGVSYGTDTAHTPKLAVVGGGQSASFRGDTDAGAELAANWSVLSAASGIATPALGNGTVNATFISNLRSGYFDQLALFRLGASSQTPAGLAIDPATGVLSGTLTALPGVYAIVIERSNGSEVVTQTVRLLVTAADGSATIPAGVTWSPNTATTLPGSLTVYGTLDTAGNALVVPGALVLSGGSAVNTAPGSIRYGSLSGGTLPGDAASLAPAGFAEWIAGYPSLTGPAALRSADPDGDGQTNFAEHAFDTDPADAASHFTGPSVGRSGARLTFTFPRGARPALRYSVQSSPDLSTWTEIWSSQGPANTAGPVTVNDTQDLPASGARFLRVLVTEP
ncbi:MAG: hypothetical protein RLZZ50_1724 [Verrucomicrobiota bacterium]